MNTTKMITTLFFISIALFGFSQPRTFNGLDMNLGNLYKLSNAETRSISPENFTGEKGKGGMAIPDRCLPSIRPMLPCCPDLVRDGK